MNSVMVTWSPPRNETHAQMSNAQQKVGLRIKPFGMSGIYTLCGPAREVFLCVTHRKGHPMAGFCAAQQEIKNDAIRIKKPARNPRAKTISTALCSCVKQCFSILLLVALLP